MKCNRCGPVCGDAVPGINLLPMHTRRAGAGKLGIRSRLPPANMAGARGYAAGRSFHFPLPSPHPMAATLFHGLALPIPIQKETNGGCLSCQDVYVKM
jgi:hypothetical protein